MQETPTGRVPAFGKKSVWESFRTGLAGGGGGGAIGAERLFSCHAASVWVRRFKPQVNCFPLKASQRKKDKNPTGDTNVAEPSDSLTPEKLESDDDVTVALPSLGSATPSAAQEHQSIGADDIMG